MTKELTNHDNLPIETNTENFQLVKPLPPTATEQDALHADLEFSNFMLDALAVCWDSVRTIKGVTALVSSTINATKHRRAILKIPYGAATQNSEKRTIDLLD